MVEALEFKGNCLSALVQMLGTRDVSERLTMLLTNLGERTARVTKTEFASARHLRMKFSPRWLVHRGNGSRLRSTVSSAKNLIRVGKRRTIL